MWTTGCWCNTAQNLHYSLDLHWGADVDFIVRFQDHHPSQQNQSGLHGIYLRAFCTGLDSVLQPYRQALLDLEQEVKERDLEQQAVLLLTDWNVVISAVNVLSSSS